MSGGAAEVGRFRAGRRTIWIGAVAAAFILAGCSSAAPSASTSPSSGGAIIASIQTPSLPGAAAAGFGSLWVSDYVHGSLFRISGSSKLSLTTIPIGNPTALQPDCQPDQEDAPAGSLIIRRCDLPSGVACGAGSVWVGRNDLKAVVRIDPASNRVTATIPVGIQTFGIEASSDAVWVTSYEDNSAVRIDPRSNQVVARIEGLHGPSGILIAPDAVWLADNTGLLVTKIDPATNAVQANVPVGSGPFPMALAAGSLWVRNEQDNTFSRVDPRASKVTASIKADPTYATEGFDSLVGGKDGVWVSGLRVGFLDASSQTVTRSLPVEGHPYDAGGGRLWVLGTTGLVSLVNPSA
jgi:streptogramin lyase